MVRLTTLLVAALALTAIISTFVAWRVSEVIVASPQETILCSFRTENNTSQKQHGQAAVKFNKSKKQEAYGKKTTHKPVLNHTKSNATSWKQPQGAAESKMKDAHDPKNQTTSPKFLVGLIVTDQPAYHDALEAEMTTWIQAIPNDRVFVVGAVKPAPHRVQPRFVKSPCTDKELWCKRIVHISEAHRLWTEGGLDFDWLLSGNEDWYVHLPVVKQHLKNWNPQLDAIIISGVGCGQMWEYHTNSKNGTVPKPPSFKESDYYCPKLAQRGGICGGSGIIFSQRTIEILGAEGQEALFHRTQTQLPGTNATWAPLDDPVLSCLVYNFTNDKGMDQIQITTPPWTCLTGPVHHFDRTMGTVHARVPRKLENTTITPASILFETHQIVLNHHTKGNASWKRPQGQGVVMPNINKQKREDKSNQQNQTISPKFLVGLIVTDQPMYHEALEAEMNTWLKSVPKHRVFVVGAVKPPPHRVQPQFVRSPCTDEELWCKRIVHISEAYRMWKTDGLDFDWLLSGKEDWYVHLSVVHQHLKKWDPQSDAIIISGVGCAQAWEHHINSKNGTVPKPQSFMERDFYCPKLAQRGGICGGSGIVFSRKVVEILGAEGHDGLFRRTRAQLPNNTVSWAPLDDPVLSCLVYNFTDNQGRDQIQITAPPWTCLIGPVHRFDVTMGTVRARVPRKLGNTTMTPAHILYETHQLVLNHTRTTT